jgi:tetratricopeptide (TPR) repeat protein
MLARRVSWMLGSLGVVLIVGLIVRSDEITLVPDATVKGVTGKSITGTIDAESPTAVRITPKSAAAVDVPVEQIESITYTGQPASMGLAQISEKNNDSPTALAQYKKAVAEAGNASPLVAEAAQYGQVAMLADLARNDPARLDEALAQLDAFTRTHPRGRHLGPALESIARLALLKGDAARADQAATALQAIPWAAGRAQLLKAKVLAKKGQNDDAMKLLDKTIADAPEGSSRRLEARLARAEALAAAGKFAEAETAVRELIKETPPEKADVQALAHNTLGDCLRTAGKLKDALFAYLQTDILYDKDKDEDARALFQIAQLWRKLNQSERADEAMARLRERYPQSAYLKSGTARP